MGTRNTAVSKKRGVIKLLLLSFIFVTLSHAAATAVCLYHTVKLLTLQLWQPRNNSSSRTSRYSFCDSYERRFCVCVCAYYLGASSTRVKFQPTLNPEFRKHPRSTAAEQQQQQRYNTSEPRDAHIHLGTLAFPFFNLRRPRDFQVIHIPKETKYVYYMMYMER